VPNLPHTRPFDPADAKAALGQLPASAAVFALYGADAHAEPYIGRTPNLRGRLERLLQPSPKHPRRLQLAARVRRIEWLLTGSDFESLLTQFSLLEEIYGEKALQRMHLGAPAFVRYLGSNRYPRITVTSRPSQKEADWSYGPFPSRAAAERFADEALKLFLLRRCVEELDPNPEHPGCVYSEMKMCLAPCYQGCTDKRYVEESTGVERFLATRGESRLVTLRTQRDEASTNLEFETAAAIHTQVQRVEAVRGLAAELVRPLSQLRAVILQASAESDEVAVFLFEGGKLRGPVGFSTVGMRIQNEQSGSSSLYAQPLAIEPVPEEQGSGVRDQGAEIRDHPQEIVEQGKGNREQGTESAEESTEEAQAAVPKPSADARPKLARGVLETRLEEVLTTLIHNQAPPSATERQGHLALLKRWYYRPEVRRVGEVFFPGDDEAWATRAILRGIGRVAAKSVASPLASRPEQVQNSQ
jgi:excinuclease UvrABC nuclease subunit